jgi:uncharacterized membrane protein
MTTTENPTVRSYLMRLEAALAHLPADERSQIVDGIEEHVVAALAELDAPTEADVRNVLAKLGDPEAIAADADERIGSTASGIGKLTTALLWVGAVVGVFDLLMVSTSQVGPIEFAFLAVPVVVLVVVALGLRRHVQRPI